ncbi:cytochrome o ubiquinol oxidase subunit IV [Falsibacillus albus]|uniref:Cytochrome o ubiquinol oxidase subunit IV n=1 Tax=Falsibacillus albus TaxID=2478915 RepID=A0A3L7JV84_9BACI|nr:cytochrome o ubiquinol oxidase subunit IV [Falsibacillus albus]RLQ92332.1 cytochrome o ubiquinol oxidase subunit IV [Falsibacillus albus]
MSHQESHGSVKAYVTGFIASIVLTIIPLVLTLKHVLTGTALIVAIITMAVLQLLVQLFFFMHIRDGEKPRYNVWGLILGLFIVIVIVAGSMWIMAFNAQVA